MAHVLTSLHYISRPNDLPHRMRTHAHVRALHTHMYTHMGTHKQMHMPAHKHTHNSTRIHMHSCAQCIDTERLLLAAQSSSERLLLAEEVVDVPRPTPQGMPCSTSLVSHPQLCWFLPCSCCVPALALY